MDRYKFRVFDYKEYEFNHKLENGDMNWIIPKKILAFSSPNDNKREGIPPAQFLETFKIMGIKSIIRLNETLYDERVFKKAGIQIYDLEFLDGSCPSFVKISSLTNLGYHETIHFNCRARDCPGERCGCPLQGGAGEDRDSHSRVYNAKAWL